MKKVGFLIFVIAIVIGISIANIFAWGKVEGKVFNFSMNFGSERGSGNVVTESRDLRDFSAVDVGGVFRVEVTAQKDFSVQIEGDDNLLPFVETSVRNGKLVISSKKRIKPSQAIIIRVSAPNVEGVRASGASKVTVADLKNSSFTVDTSGASKVELAGETSDLTVDVSGASKIDAEALNAVNAHVDASGASKVALAVSGDLKTDASGASKITYVGSPTVSKNTSGASKVTQKS